MIIKIIIDVLLFVLGYIISYLVNKYDINTYLKYIRCNKYIYRELKDQINYHKFGNLSFEDYKNKIIEAITYELSLNRSIMDTDFNDFYNHIEAYIMKHKDCLNRLKIGYEDDKKNNIKIDEKEVDQEISEEDMIRFINNKKNNEKKDNGKVTLPNEVYDRDSDPLTDPFRM